MTDEELILAIGKRDQEAFSTLYERYWRLLYQWSVRRLGDRESAKDFLQTFWVNIWENPTVLKADAEGSIRIILLRLLSFRLLDLLKSPQWRFSAREEALPDDSESFAYSHVLEDYELTEIHDSIDRYLELLPEVSRQIYELSEKELKSPEEISRVVSLSEYTVKQRLSSVNTFLRKQLQKTHFEQLNNSEKECLT